MGYLRRFQASRELFEVARMWRSLVEEIPRDIIMLTGSLVRIQFGYTIYSQSLTNIIMQAWTVLLEIPSHGRVSALKLFLPYASRFQCRVVMSN